MVTDRAMSTTYRVRPASAATSGRVVMPGPFMVLAARTRIAEKGRDFLSAGGGVGLVMFVFVVV